LEREITFSTETNSLLQKTELLDNSITVADFAHHTRGGWVTMVQGIIMRGIGDGLEARGTYKLYDVVIQCAPIFPMPYFNTL
jgi:hypothetical protein